MGTSGLHCYWIDSDIVLLIIASFVGHCILRISRILWVLKYKDKYKVLTEETFVWFKEPVSLLWASQHKKCPFYRFGCHSWVLSKGDDSGLHYLALSICDKTNRLANWATRFGVLSVTDYDTVKFFLISLCIKLLATFRFKLITLPSLALWSVWLLWF